MFRKILIANRGEIAARIIRTCRKMGIETVAVYSEADQMAPYVQQADESYLIGPPRVSESYLNASRILEIAKITHADAIHPGYGFLSENEKFAEECAAEGVIFIGPSSSILNQMGNKIAARKAMKAAGLPIIPGTDDAVDTVKEALSAARGIGYPIMLKATAGGGGIGMEVVHTDEELIRAFESNSKRALSFFGDGSMFIEKKIENARHIEIQVMADQHGQAVHLYDRECSIQRRNQKVVEEAPSIFITEKTRKLMGEAAVDAIKQLGYTNAGTLEFLVDSQENFYFLEMNTRIQVEHPITEEITGIDIVEEQIKIAGGMKLAIRQEDVHVDGHAIEVRIYAEDPITFFPSPGHISTFELPVGQFIRNETAVVADYDVTPFYDPMISKLIVKGNDRDAAIRLLKQALSEYKIEGIRTNIPMLLKIVEHEQFIAGNTTTSFVDQFYLQQNKEN
ncbi:acetyl-CoA carboxylase biotin carboxylase subunit [Oceanobacillus massiliensis]|uniref:acetyl-CoA carboxylase biotin carboxylase subunit n=1 Tax=Oceanobacillus massiliensis TaxID=1465765 RepID=UPI000287FDAA|nr:acetyl-CoA carboxylase biotin carboxylase subunit [Oceanobacillus massiliensis]